MSIFVTLFRVLVVIYRWIAAMWNACITFLRVMQSVMQEAKQEAVELMALLDDGAPVMDAITSTSVLHDAGVAGDPANPWQMLIITRASSFVLLLRLSKRRVLHLEVDEDFITAKLEVVRTGLVLHVRHVPRLLRMPTEMHDTRLVRYTPMRLPCLWREEQTGPQYGDRGGIIERSIVSVPTASVSTGEEERSHRQKCVQLLTESALRRRMQMGHLERAEVDIVPKKGTGTVRTQGENVVKRKALANATNAGVAHGEENAGADGETYGPKTGAADASKQVWMERNIHAVLSENVSISNMAQPSSRKVAESRRMSSQSLRRKQRQFDLYAQRASSEFSLLSKKG